MKPTMIVIESWLSNCKNYNWAATERWPIFNPTLQICHTPKKVVFFFFSNFCFIEKGKKNKREKKVELLVLVPNCHSILFITCMNMI